MIKRSKSMRKTLAIFLGIQLFLGPSSIWADCFVNYPPLSSSGSAQDNVCFPNHSPNEYDTYVNPTSGIRAGWCVNRDRITITQTQTSPSSCRYMVKVKINTKLCDVQNLRLLSYKHVYLKVVKKAPAGSSPTSSDQCTAWADNLSDFGIFSRSASFQGIRSYGPVVIGPIPLYRRNPSSRTDDFEFETISGEGGSNSPIDFGPLDKNISYYFEVHLRKSDIDGRPAEWTGMQRKQWINQCPPPTSPSPTQSQSPSPSPSPSASVSPSASPSSSLPSSPPPTLPPSPINSPSVIPSASPSASEYPTEIPTDTPTPTSTDFTTPYPTGDPTATLEEPVDACGNVLQALSLNDRTAIESEKNAAKEGFLAIGPVLSVGGGGGSDNVSSQDALPIESSLNCETIFLFDFDGDGLSAKAPNQQILKLDLPEGASNPRVFKRVGTNNWKQDPSQQVTQGAIVLSNPASGLYRVFATIVNLPFSFGEVYVFPNPFRSNDNPILHVEVGMANSVSTRIYDPAGDLVYETRVDSAVKVVNGKPAYEAPLDITHLKPGAYIGIVTATKNGSESLRKRYRFIKK